MVLLLLLEGILVAPMEGSPRELIFFWNHSIQQFSSSFSPCRIVLSCISLTTKTRWSRPVRLRRTGAWWKGITLFTASLHPPQKRRRSGSTASSEQGEEKGNRSWAEVKSDLWWVFPRPLGSNKWWNTLLEKHRVNVFLCFPLWPIDLRMGKNDGSVGRESQKLRIGSLF